MTPERLARLRAWVDEAAGFDVPFVYSDGIIRLLDEHEALLDTTQAALSTHLHPFGDHTADACGMCEKFRAAIALAEGP